MGWLKEITYEYLGSLKYVKEIRREVSLPITNDIAAVIGPRRVGKTFLMLKKASELVKDNPVIYASFDEPSLRKINVKKFAELIREEYPEGKVFLFLDEIQEWENWDYNLRWLHDIKDFYIYVSGSSSSLQSSEIPSRLRGRYISKLVLPLSFREIANFEIRTFRERGKAKRLLREYLKWGGFPEVWLEKSREKVIAILETAFYRDIVERQRIEDLSLFKDFFYFILSNFANKYTYNSLKRTLEGYAVNIDVKTVIKYINAVKNAFLIFEVYKFAYSEKEKIKSQKKLYIVDTSFSNLFRQGLDIGRKMENLVFLELFRKYGEVYYYVTKNQEEIDFFVPRGKVLIEVSYDYDENHIKKLFKAMKELRIKESIIVTWDHEDEKQLGKTRRIRCIPLWKWLLGIYEKF
ncbi:MAG: ATP-binding protein [Thermoproteales archaeon]|nr:ATP-binding protein [Thermoproteales archaeon]